MYKMPHFTEEEKEATVAFMKAHPFVTLVGTDGLRSAATQVPVLVHEGQDGLTLRGHIMRNTDHYKAILANPEVLVLFTGPQCYVSSSWYKERGTGGTWNYMTVQARGRLTFDDERGPIELLSDLTRHFELGQRQPELVENMPEEYVTSNVKAISVFKIAVTELHATFKLSQNKDDETYERIVRELSELNDYAANEIPDEMVRRRPGLFTG